MLAKKKENTQEEILQTKTKEYIFTAIACLFPLVAYFVYEFIFETNWISNMLLLGFLAFYAIAFGFVLVLEQKKNVFLSRFTCVFCLAAVIVLVQNAMPYTIWMYSLLAVSFILVSNLQIAVFAYFYVLTLQALSSFMDIHIFLGYAVIGMVSLILFGNMDREFRFQFPLFATLLFQFVGVNLIDFCQNYVLSFDVILFAAIQCFVTFFLLSFVLYLVSHYIIHKEENRFAEINDPEYVLLTELKKRNEKEYYHAIHTAYFCEKIAKKIGANEMLCKAGGYYHKIGKLRGKKNLKNIYAIANEHRFPLSLVDLLKEYCGKNSMPTSKEVAIVIFADAMVSSVMFLFEQDKNAVLDYKRLANVVFQKQLDAGILKHCKITMEELNLIQDTFMEENLYYDFLR